MTPSPEPSPQVPEAGKGYFPSGGAPPKDGALAHLREAIRAFAWGRVWDAALAEDITQETLLRVHQRLGSLRAGEKFEAWVFRIARHVVADHFRRTRPTEPFVEQAHAPPSDAQRHEPLAAEEEQLRQELFACLRKVVEGLPVIYRDALRLVEFEGVSQVELASRLGLSVSAAKSRVQRARQRVRAELERCCRWETDRYGAVVDVRPKRRECCQTPPADS